MAFTGVETAREALWLILFCRYFVMNNKCYPISCCVSAPPGSCPDYRLPVYFDPFREEIPLPL